jgi:capsular exopolysaccharide synthesis family protein
VSRIHQILTRADRDGTTAGLTSPQFPPLVPSSGQLPLDSRVERVDADYGEPAISNYSDRFAPGNADDAEPLRQLPPDAELDQRLVAILQPLSPAGERFRALGTRIATHDGESPQVIAVTSPNRSDGKTLTGFNLALAMAREADCRTLLIDAHLRRPRIHAMLGVAREPGLVDVLIGRTRLEHAVVTLGDGRPQILTAGAAIGQAAALLRSAEMHELMVRLRSRFDRIVIDAASSETAEAGALASLVDGVLLVVRAGRTRQPDIDRALGSVPAAKLIGMVLNDCRTVNELQDA